jgi:hypothetical protein
MCLTEIQQKFWQKTFQKKIVIFYDNSALDNETKNKLKILIQSHMSKLLMRIEEENQSINSDKSLNF